MARSAGVKETKGEFTQRLKAEGRWPEFTKRREALKRNGVPASEAWERLRPEFAPLAASEPVSTVIPAEDDECEDEVEGGVAEAAVAAPGAGAGAAADGVTFEKLAMAARGRTASRTAEVEWVQQQLAIASLDDIDPATVPSASAVALLKWAMANTGDFFCKLYSSQLPTKKQLEEQQRFNDDGQDTIALIEKLEQLRERDLVLEDVADALGTVERYADQAAGLTVTVRANVRTHLRSIRGLLGIEEGAAVAAGGEGA